MPIVRMPIKRVSTSNLMVLEWCFLISKVMRIAMQCYPSLYYIMYLETFLLAVQPNVFISLLWFLFIDAAGNEHSQLVEIPEKRSTFKCNIKKKQSQIITIKKNIVTFKNRNVQFRFETSMTDTSKDQLMTKDKLPTFRVELKVFTRLPIKLVL